METNTAERLTQAILEKAVELSELLYEAVPDGPSYWRPYYLEGQEFPMKPEDFTWLRSSLSTLISVLGDEDE